MIEYRTFEEVGKDLQKQSSRFSREQEAKIDILTSNPYSKTDLLQTIVDVYTQQWVKAVPSDQGNHIGILRQGLADRLQTSPSECLFASAKSAYELALSMKQGGTNKAERTRTNHENKLGGILGYIFDRK